MRPLKLSLKGFTSFRDHQEIDFEDLDLFALWGPTGSGKSSLLDAITYALYGTVERIGTRGIGELVSQGQPRMTVTLDFAVDGAAFRVTRSTPRSGSTASARLEKREGSEWVSYGPGSDRVRDVGKMIEELVGLDYDAFTRSVLLPQGKFAEFMVGDADKRRTILTELLGLELFKKMAARANEITRGHRDHAAFCEESLARDYEGIDEEALGAATAESEAAKKQAKVAKALAKQLAGLARDFELAGRSIEALRPCVTETEELAEAFEADAADLEEHERAVAEAGRVLTEVRELVEKAGGELTAAGEEWNAAIEQWGTLEDLGALTAEATHLVAARAEAAAAANAAEGAERARVEAGDHLEQTAAAVAVAEKTREGAAVEVERLEGEHRAAQHQDLVGTLVEGLEAGSPCPVCEHPLQKLPDTSPAQLKKAAKALEVARKAAHEADAAAAEAVTARAVAEKSLEAAGAEAERLGAALQAGRTRCEEAEARLAPHFSGSVPEDAASQLKERLASLRALADGHAKARLAHRARVEEQDAAQVAAGALGAEVAKIQARMAGAGVEGALKRAAAAAPGIELPDVLPLELPEGAAALAQVAEDAAKALESLGRELLGAIEELERSRNRLSEDAFAAIPAGYGLAPALLEELVDEVEERAAEADRAAALAEREVERLVERLEARRRLEAEIGEDNRQGKLYYALHMELRNDHIVQYLQAEALVTLAAAATDRLHELSGSRYRLVYEDDRFFVVDSWNGDERRNVRTLSGGETFLASLALALALSEQIQLLAVTEKGRLESLFLDEGFGTLDAETLETVVAALEQLRGDDRLVGVITHVSELADRMPVKLIVSKSPRGSSLRVEAGDAPFGL